MKTFIRVLAAAAMLSVAQQPAMAQGQAPAPKPAAQAPAAPAPAQQIEAPIIAVIDINEVMQRSKAGQSVQPQIEKLRKGYEDEITKDRDGLATEAKQLESQRAVLAPEAFGQRVNALRQREQSIANQINDRKRILDNTLAGGLSQIRNVLVQVTADVARERGINIVLPKDSIVIVARDLEITEEVIKRVDAKLPSVTLKVAQPATQGAAPRQPAAPKAQPAPRDQQIK
jgi:Skp family chaperone for outer membrane proteins